MSQFIIENPFLSILIAYIIGAVVMHIISVLAIRMTVEKEVEKALGEEDDDRIGLYPVKPSNAPVPPAPIVHERVLPIWLGKDEDGQAYIFFEEPTKYDGHTGPYRNSYSEAYYETESEKHLCLDDFEDSHSTIISDLKNELHRMDNLKYGVLKINLYDDDVVRFINATFV